MAWTNEDGLQVRFNLERTTEAPAGRTGAVEKMLIVELPDATALADTDTAAVDGDDAFLPAGALITSAHLYVDTAFTTGDSAVLDIGLKKADGTNIDDDGIDAGVAAAALAANMAVACDGELADGTEWLEFDSYVMFTTDTGSFTAGAGKVIIKYVEVA